MRLNSPRLHPHFFLLLCLLCLSCESFGQAGGAADPTPADSSASTAKGFFGRWADFYRQDWWGKPASPPAPPRRGLPSPLDSPPFPNEDWSYGGSPVIGELNTKTNHRMTVFNKLRELKKL